MPYPYTIPRLWHFIHPDSKIGYDTPIVIIVAEDGTTKF